MVQGANSWIPTSDDPEVLFRACPVPQWLFEPETLRFVEVNDAAIRAYGFSRAEFLGMTIKDIRPAEESPGLLEHLRAGTEPVRTAVHTHRRRDGSTFRAETTARRVVWRGRTHQLVVVRDVSESLEAHEALRVSEAKLGRLASSGIIGIATTDIYGRIFEVNDAYVRMLGYSREELLSDAVRWVDLTPPEWAAADARAIEQLRRVGSATPWEKELLHKDGHRVPILIGAAQLEGASCIVFLTDLTERKRAEAALKLAQEQLLQAQKMEAVGRLAGGVAHDFNNHLSVIMSYADLIVDELGPSNPICADAEEIRSAGRRAAALTRQLLMFSRHERVAEPAVVDIAEVLTGMQKMLPRLLVEDIGVVADFRSRGRSRIDPGHVEQVLMNLVVNARDAMPDGGRVTISTSDVLLDEAFARAHPGITPGLHVVLTVSDTGTGMDAATMARIFEPFFTTKDASKGTGLGLATVFGIMQQCGGIITVDSEPGKGATFKAYFPRVDDAAPAQTTSSPARDSTRPPAGSEVVLLVEDDEQVRRVASSILRRAGYDVFEASNAKEAMRVFEGRSYAVDLLLSDVVMPNGSGFELACDLQEYNPRLKILLMSGYSGELLHRHGRSEGVFPLVRKPLTPAVLARRVREVLAM